MPVNLEPMATKRKSSGGNSPYPIAVAKGIYLDIRGTTDHTSSPRTVATHRIAADLEISLFHSALGISGHGNSEGVIAERERQLTSVVRDVRE